MRLAATSPIFSALNRVTASAILRNENAILARLRSASAKATRTMAHATTVANTFGDSTSSLVILGSARGASYQLHADVAGAILDGRQRARETAHQRLDAELSAINLGADRPPLLAHRKDAERASAASDTYVRAWVAEVTKATPEGKPTAATVKAASGSQDYRLRRIAATENADAYSQEHGEAARWIGAHYRDVFFGAYRRWEALLDKHVCKVCKSMDGQLAPLDGFYANHWEPGSVHPFCRCFDTLVLVRKRVAVSIGAGHVTKRRAMTTTLRPTAPTDKTPWGGGGEWGGGGSSGTF